MAAEPIGALLQLLSGKCKSTAGPNDMPTSLLSPTMQAALAAIETGGGECHPIEGGWWSAKAGSQQRLTFVPVSENPLAVREVLTNTVMALVARGCLVAIPGSGTRWMNAFRVATATMETERLPS